MDKWKQHAIICDETICETSLSGKIVTLRREISKTSGRPISIFFGPLEEALKSTADGWMLCSSSRDQYETRRSFSQVLFEALNIPEIPGDGGANITMHQILRLMYVDQTSPFQRIFRIEKFDPKETREAVTELLFGIGGYDLYSKRLELRSLDKQFSDVSAKFTSLNRIASALSETLNVEAISVEKNSLQTRRAVLVDQIDKLQSEGGRYPNLEKRYL